MARAKQDSHRLRAVLCADAVGYSRLLGADEPSAIATMDAYWSSILPCVEKGGGESFGLAGDGFLAVFDTATDAVACSVAIQRLVSQLNRSNEAGLPFRIGVAMGEIAETRNGLVGISINIATRLQALASPGGICITDPVHREVANKLPFAFDEVGPTELHNIDFPVGVVSVRWSDLELASRPRPEPAPRSHAGDNQTLSMLAVLPFDDFSGDPRWTNIADGLVEEIITQIALTHWITVIARSSTFIYKGRSVDVRMIGRELSVRYALEGSIRVSGERLRATVQLVSCLSGEHVWAKVYEGTLDEIFQLQDRIAIDVATSIEPQITEAEVNRIRRKPVAALSAYELYLTAMHYRRNRTPSDTRTALSLLRDSLAHDPDFARARAAAAACLLAIRDQHWGAFSSEDEETAISWAEMAAKAEPSDPTVLFLAGHVLACLTQPIQRGLAMIDKSLQLNRSCSDAWARSAMTHIYLGELEVAEAHARTAIGLSPLDSHLDIPLCALGYSHLFSGRYHEALDAGFRAQLVNRASATTQRIMLTAAYKLGDAEMMAEARQSLLEIAPDFTIESWISRTPLYLEYQIALLTDALQAAGFQVNSNNKLAGGGRTHG